MPDRAQPVEVINPEPLLVEDASTEPRDVRIVEEPDTQPQATARIVREAARVDANILSTQGQRDISRIWERTQQIIALMVVTTTVAVSAILCISIVVKMDATAEERAIALTAFTLLATLTGSVIGFYFGRTNHQRVPNASSLGVGDNEIMGR